MQLRCLLILATLGLGLPWAVSGAEPGVAADSSDMVSAEPPNLARGGLLFLQYCARCHGVQGGGGVGPAINHPDHFLATTDAAMDRIIAQGLPESGMPGFEMLDANDRASVVAYIRSLEGAGGEEPAGDPGAGAEVFTRAECHKCHVLQGEGRSWGPDLTYVGARRSMAFLRDAVLHPGQDKPADAQGWERYQVIHAFTREGVEIHGYRVNEDTFTLQIRDLEGRLHSLRKDAVRWRRLREQSLMPSFQETLTAREVEDLVAFLGILKGDL